MGFIADFKTFISQGNALDLAVGVIIGASFGKIVTSVVNDLIMPPIGLAMGNVNFTDLKVILKPAQTLADGTIAPAITLNYGNFIQAGVDFLIVAFCVFLIVKAVNSVRKPKPEAPAAPPAPTDEVILLRDIRDLLKSPARANDMAMR
ncbi:MAG: large-conductance mechanosensitive channel protein MscL [Vampirovibrionales bacterium]|nr:large-conductance mechanosensitive channel protein MscL [Vampirovibrionales bacterium]